MDEGIRRLELELNPAHLASIIDNAIVISSEIVNFHFSALASADLTQPAKAADARYRFQTPAISAADRRAMQECWILAKAFQELLRAVRHSLEEAYVFVALLTGKHKIKSSATLSECQKPFKSKAAGLRFPDLLDAVNDKLDPKIDFSAAYVSLQAARNCLEHRDGERGRADIHDGPEHNALQSEAGYIDARPQSRQIVDTSCDARPDHTIGSITPDQVLGCHFRTTPDSGYAAAV